MGLTYDKKKTKLAAKDDRQSGMFLLCYSTEGHMLPCYSWILAITRAYSPLRSTSSRTAFNRQNGRWTCEWPNSKLDPPLVASLFRLVVIHSMASYVIRYDCKLVARHSWFFSHANFYRVTHVTQGSRAQVVGRSLIDRKASRVSRSSFASVSWW